MAAVTVAHAVPAGSGPATNDVLAAERAPLFPGLKAMGAPAAGPAAAAPTPLAIPAPAAPGRLQPTAVAGVANLTPTIGAEHIVLPSNTVRHVSTMDLGAIHTALEGGLAADDEGNLHRVGLASQRHLNSLSATITNTTDHPVLVRVPGVGNPTAHLAVGSHKTEVGHAILHPNETKTINFFDIEDTGTSHAIAQAGMPDIGAIKRAVLPYDPQQGFAVRSDSPIWGILEQAHGGNNAAGSLAIMSCVKAARANADMGFGARPVYNLDQGLHDQYVQAIGAAIAKHETSLIDPSKLKLEFVAAHPWASLPPVFAHANSDNPHVAALISARQAMPPTFPVTMTVNASAPVTSAVPVASV